ncbi:granulocyte colony-stimulating factor receptor isoform X2 [Crotalus tigris]|uniref:granulocyte colony-stimulating factor receptor isoform X2 n=1 Tax=Crotalus tigris TaxID=88082 RepID=UPI00192F1889|nr:granulocyte colony-stimulating factor receptor isoform X2 [Crotalus tigris]
MLRCLSQIMRSIWEPWSKMLGCALLLLWMPGGSLSCSHLTVNSSAVILGGNITASCTIWRNHCPVAKGSRIQIIWKLGNQQLQGSQKSFSNGVEVSNITIGPFKEPVTPLSCCIQEHDVPQIMNLTQIQAGYPPSQPQNLTCIFNITSKNLACQWDPGRDSLLPTHVALKGFRSSRECKALAPIADCIPKPGQQSCTFQRLELQLYQKMLFWVSVENALGNVTSERLCADPMDLAWLEPPTIQDIQLISEESDCLMVKWEAGKDSKFMEQGCDLRYQLEGSLEWSLVHNITTSSRQIRQIQQCGFLFGSLYHFQMRCRRQPLSYWSSWSPAKLFTTQEKAPSGSLDAWWKLREAEKGTEVQLLWKPMKPQEANGRILGYWAALSTGQHTGHSPSLCNTTERQCTFLMPPGAKRVYLTAYNSRGASQATEIFLLQKKGHPVLKIQASPHDEKSFRLWWDPPRTPVTGYIVEWHRVTSAAEDSNIEWQKLQNESIRETLIQENIEPFQRYNISVYPLYRDTVGVPQSIEAYTRQKAPTSSPKVYPLKIGVSTAEVWWSPLPVEDQNGFLTGYTLFWIDPNEEARSIAVNTSIDILTISGLRPSTMYSLHLMASTMVGSTNGTSVVITTKDMEYLDITIVYLVIGLLLAMIIGMVICFQKSKRMKMQFWPSVPDPANSSLGKWAPAVLQEETLQAPKPCELSPVIVSAFLVIEADEKKCLSCGKSEPGPATEDSPVALSDSGAREAKGAVPTGGSGPTSYMNNPEPVQYAKVLGGSYHLQQKASPTIYIRSSSRQPLLRSLSPSPKSYKNLWFHSDQPERATPSSFQEETVFLDGALLDFPLLQGLKIDGDEDLCNFRRL